MVSIDYPKKPLQKTSDQWFSVSKLPSPVSPRGRCRCPSWSLRPHRPRPPRCAAAWMARPAYAAAMRRRRRSTPMLGAATGGEHGTGWDFRGKFNVYIYIYNLTSGVLQDSLAEGHFLWQGSQCLRNLKQVYTYIYIYICVCVCMCEKTMGISPIHGNITCSREYHQL